MGRSLHCYEQFLTSRTCALCHGGSDETILISKPWSGSMHGNSGRDPMWYACLAVAEQDSPFIGDMCIRCQVPRAWLSGRGYPTDGRNISKSDRDSITCTICQRMEGERVRQGRCRHGRAVRRQQARGEHLPGLPHA